MTGARVIYIEDNFDNRLLVRRVLEIEGFVVFGAEDGPTGIKLALEENPDIILMDINLPEMDGYEVTTRLRQYEELAQVPIIALTANVMKGDRERTLLAGCDGYIQKPIDVDKLPQQIREFLSTRQGG